MGGPSTGNRFFRLKHCIPPSETGIIPTHGIVTGVALFSGVYLHKSIDKRRPNRDIPRPLNCLIEKVWELDLGQCQIS
ncbi:hypothetical protein D8L93_07630 [Sodalis-like symbiont of Bactericera trigonica]|nr:hypothetical protein D8L93_07630 [Sodalis-like symbiont of Bactericera trigonica]